MTLSRRKIAITVTFSIYKYPTCIIILCFSVTIRSRLTVIPELNCEDLYYTNNKFLPLFKWIKKAAFLLVGKILKVTKLNTHFLYQCPSPEWAVCGAAWVPPQVWPRVQLGKSQRGEPSAYVILIHPGHIFSM